MKQVKFWNYGHYVSDNYGKHSLAFNDNYGNEFYFSYETLVAFYDNKKNEWHIHENDWGQTTGKHLNWINPDKSIRENDEQFQLHYADFCKAI